MESREISRIKEAYKKRFADPVEKRKWSYYNIANLFIVQKREREIIKLLVTHGIEDLSQKRILDVGCGKGGILREFVKYGANPDNLFGVDLMEAQVGEARRISPNISVQSGNAEKLPFQDQSFDIVMQYTCFSSILDDDVQANIAQEMLRVLKDGGLVIWYDLKPNIFFPPQAIKRPILFILKKLKLMNLDTVTLSRTPIRSTDKKQITHLFPNCRIQGKSLSLYLRVAYFARISWSFCELLEKIPLFRTHYLLGLRKGTTKNRNMR